MEITTTNPNATTPLAAARAEEQDKPGIASDFETFLRMLTVQMENQDPLNPVKAEEFAVQLATFAGVEQQAYTNKLLEELQNKMGLTSISEYADWIGREVRAPVAASFDGTPINVISRPDPSADETFLVVHDSQGLEVQRTAIPTENANISWDGTTASGLPLPSGLYSFTIENWKEGGLASRDTAEVYTTVVEARLDGTTPMIVTEGGVEIPADEVTGLRE